MFIVARDQFDLWQRLRRDFAEEEEFQVVLDRRRGQRRRRVEGRGPERRLGERRQPRIDRDLRYRSFVIIYTQERVPVA